MLKFHIEANNKHYDADVSTADEILSLQQELLESIPDERDISEASHKVKESVERNLFTATDYYGNAVEPLKESTIKRKGHSKVFFDSGELYRSVIEQPITDGNEIVIDENRSQIASWLHYGTEKMVARPFFGLAPERAESIILETLSEKLKMLG